jgi:hypothetical protein
LYNRPELAAVPSGHNPTPLCPKFERLYVMPQKSERLKCWYYSCERLMMYAVQVASCGVVYLTGFMNIGTGLQVILRFVLSNLYDCNVGITDGRTYELPLEMCPGGMIYVQSIVKIGTGIQVILRLSLSNLKCWCYWWEIYEVLR